MGATHAVAKKKTTKKTGSKSAEIRKYLARNPSAGSKKVKSALAQKGIEVSEGLVANVKFRAAQSAGATPRQARKKTVKRAKSTRKKVTGSRPSEDLKRAGDLMRQAVDLVIKAGAKEAKQLVGIAEEMVRSIRER